MKKLSIILVVSLLFFSCSKDSNSENPTIDNSVNPKEETEDNSSNPSETSKEFEDNVLYFSDDNSDLVSSEEDIENGRYIFNHTGDSPKVKEGDIIVGDEGEGFLRKVESISTNNNQMIFQTSQASLDDLFKDAEFSFNSNDAEYSKGSNQFKKTTYSKLAKGVTVSTEKNIIELGDVILKDEAGYSVTIKKGIIDFDVPIDFSADFNASNGVNELDFNVTNAKLGASYDIEFKFEGGSAFIEDKQTLFVKTKLISFLVGIVPVVIVIKSELIAKFKARNTSNITFKKHFDQTYDLTTKINYSEGQWSNSFEHSLDSSSESPEINLVTGLELSLVYELKNDVKIYGVAGPYITPELNFTGEFNVGVPSADWDASVKVAADIKYGVELNIIKEAVIAKYEQEYSLAKRLIWEVPHAFEIVSGNNQKGNFGESLPEPLSVSVRDNYNNPFPFIPIYYEINEGGGSVSDNIVKSDESGNSQTIWTLGPQDSQEITAFAKKGDGSIIEESSLIFIAEGNSTDSDEDGVGDDLDQCPETPNGEIVDANGCTDSQKDSDGDGIYDDLDICPNTPNGDTVTPDGCTDNWDPNDESTWAVRRDLLIGGVQMISSNQSGYSVQLSLNDDGDVNGPGGAIGNWNYNGKTLTISWTRSFSISDLDENNNPIEVPCTISGSFSGNVVNYTTADGSASNSSSCCDENCGLQFWNGPAIVSF